jgi:Tol biopolymer transport system component
MQNKNRLLIAFFVLAALALACVSPAVTQPPNVETIVAMTFQALTAPAYNVTPVPSSLLPRSLYFLNHDNAGLMQVFRLERDGTTLKQITFEPANVVSYDVSPVDGSVAYTSNNQLLLINADGSNRRLLVNGGAVDQNNPFINSIYSPAFSPNGQTVAYGLGGLNLYAIATGTSNRVIENMVDNNGGFVTPRELYWPIRYSPDGSKLLIQLGYYEGGTIAIYYPAGNALVRLQGTENGNICCSEVTWSADGTSLYYGSSTMGMFSSGMWRINAADGVVTTLLPGDAGNGAYNFAKAPFLGPDGQLYYFFANTPANDEFITRPPLQLVRSAPDGISGRTVINQEIFNTLNEALWSPDGSFVIVVKAPMQDIYQGGQAGIVYLDGRAGVTLVSFAQDLRWGP